MLGKPPISQPVDKAPSGLSAVGSFHDVTENAITTLAASLRQRLCRSMRVHGKLREGDGGDMDVEMVCFGTISSI